MSTPESASDRLSLDFLRALVAEDQAAGRYDGRVHTRFPPEPNGYLHIGHAKAICIDFEVAREFGGLCNLRFDDTNPTKEETEFVESIQNDIRWLGYDWEDRLFFASDYFETLCEHAEDLIRQGKAYVDDQTPEQIRENRGTLTEPGRESPFRTRGVEENLDLFHRMRDGQFPDGSRVLRAKIDMASPNLNLRDPVMYRILHAHHHRTGDRWCVYPMYDWAHGLEDSIEGVTHSFCTIEYENHRPLYDWFLQQLPVHRPRQIEFAPLSLTYTVLSKRRLRRLVEEGHVNGWDDPRMPTLCGLRKRGCDPEGVRTFCRRVGVTKVPSVTDVALFEHCQREVLNRRAPRAMAVLDPIKLVVDNYPEGQVEKVEAVNNPEDPTAGTRLLPFSRELCIERADFMEDAPKKYFRLTPGREVRLRYAYVVRCTGCVKDAGGAVTEVHCEYDPATRGGDTPDGRRIKGTIHWVSAEHAVPAEVRCYDRLFTAEAPMDAPGDDGWLATLNPDSLTVLRECRLEPALADAAPGLSYQFERVGYFCADPDSCAGNLVFNRTVTLKDSWTKKAPKPAARTSAPAPQQDNPPGVARVEFADFAKLDMRTATVTAAEAVPDADRLLKLQLDVAGQPRQIVAGIARHYTPADVVGKTIVIVANLKPATIRGVESQGMLLAAKKKKKLELVTADTPVPSGVSVG